METSAGDRPHREKYLGHAAQKPKGNGDAMCQARRITSSSTPGHAAQKPKGNGDAERHPLAASTSVRATRPRSRKAMETFLSPNRSFLYLRATRPRSRKAMETIGLIGRNIYQPFRATRPRSRKAMETASWDSSAISA